MSDNRLVQNDTTEPCAMCWQTTFMWHGESDIPLCHKCELEYHQRPDKLPLKKVWLAQRKQRTEYIESADPLGKGNMLARLCACGHARGEVEYPNCQVCHLMAAYAMSRKAL